LLTRCSPRALGRATCYLAWVWMANLRFRCRGCKAERQPSGLNVTGFRKSAAFKGPHSARIAFGVVPQRTEARYFSCLSTTPETGDFGINTLHLMSRLESRQHIGTLLISEDSATPLSSRRLRRWSDMLLLACYSIGRDDSMHGRPSFGPLARPPEGPQISQPWAEKNADIVGH
jgi:hypothetical protein